MTQEISIGILNGPNLHRLGKREPEIYGTQTLAEIEEQLVRLGKELKLSVSCAQSNDEAILIDQIYAWSDAGFTGLIGNFGAYTHTSIALRDAIAGSSLRFVEVHLSNLYTREAFRHHSYMSSVAEGVICGLGAFGYEAALRHFAATQA